MAMLDRLRAPFWRRAVGEIGLAPTVWAGVASAAEVAAIVLLPAQRGQATRVYAIAIGVLGAWTVVRLTGPATRSGPTLFEAVIRPRRRPPVELDELRGLERLVSLSVMSAFDLHFRLKPLIREIARGRLLLHRSVDLEARPEEARRILGEPLWELIQISPERPEYGLPGIPLAVLEDAVDRLEQI